jgi:DNA-binding response OmpR family regulator
MGRILLVDDDEAILGPVARYFGAWAARSTPPPKPRKPGRSSFRRYDAAILDLRLTNLGGTEGLSSSRRFGSDPG